MKKFLQTIKNQITVATVLIFSFFTINTQAQVTITAGGGAAAVIAGIGGPGLTVSNVTINCGATSYGQFSNGASSGLGVNGGLMLSTGNVNQLTGANSNDDMDFCVGTSANDPQLTSISSQATNDVCIIEFDVVPQCANMSITFVFGSDEYMNWVGQSFNDAFGFFVSGPNPGGGNYVNQNIAVLPNGTVVGIDNVNSNPGSNPAFYVNNTGQSNSFDGFTTVITPTIAVTPCATYHFKLAIGDATDCAVDSGVLIDIIQCVSPWTVATATTPSGCGVSTGTATATVSGGIGPFTYLWSPGGQVTSTATGLAPGNYSCTVNDGLSCTPSQVVNVTVGSTGGAPNTTITPAGPFCQTAAAVNLTAATAGGTWSGTGITNAATGTFNPATAGPGSHTITYTIGGACPGSSTTTIIVNAPTVPTFAAHPAICSGGTITLPTTSTNGITGTWSPAINNTLTTTYTFTPSAGQCATTTTMTVNVTTPTTPTFVAHPAICSGGTITLPTTSTNGITGTWSPAVNNTATTPYTFTPTAGQCATTTSMTVTVNTPTTPTFVAHPPICSGGTITLPTTSTNGITGTWSPAVNNTATTPYTFTPTAGQCANTTTMTVTVGAPATPTFAAIAPICSGGTFTLPTTSIEGFTGTWSPAINNTATTPYTFTPTAGQCATTATMTVTVNNPVTPTFAAIAAICSGGTFTLPTNSTNGISGTWSPAIDNTTTTTYTFTPTAGQCANTTTMTVTVNPIPTVTVPANISACPGDNIPASAFTSNPAGATFDWTNSNTGIGLGAGGTGNTPSFTATNGTGSSITGNISVIPTLNGCIGSPVVYTITVNDLFDPTINPAGPFCADAASVNLTAVDAGGTWSGIGITNAATGTFDPATAGAGTHIITYTIAGACGGTDTENIIVNPVPIVNPIANIAACEGDPVAASNYSSTPAGATFDWVNSNTSIGLGAGATGNAPGFTATNGTGSAITGTITVTPTLNGCLGTPLTYTITINDQFDATITPAGPFCADAASVNLNAVDAGGTWSGVGITNGATGTFDPATAGAGTHTITYTIGGSCGDTDTEDIIVNPVPVVDPIANIAACEGDPVAASNYSSTPAGATFDWVNSNTSIGLGAGATGNAPGFTATNGTGSAITGTISVTPTLNGCIGLPVTYTITVNDQFNATISAVGPFCESDASITLTAVDAGGTWSGNGITDALLGTFDPTTAGAGTHTITYTIGGSCGDVQTTSIIINPDMDATITAAGPFCTNDPAIALTAVDAGGVWSGIGITNAALGIFDPSIAGNGTHTITYTIAGACGDVQTTNILVSSQLDATITPVANVCEQDAAFNLVAVDNGGTWSGTGITDPVNGTFNPSTAGPGTHIITYTIGGSCGDIQTTNITVLNNADATITPAGPFCTGNTSTTLVAVDAGGTWSGTGITNGATGTFDPAIAGVGTHLITYSIPGQCGDVQTVEIVVVSNFDATITQVGPFCENAGVVDLNTVNGGGTFTGNGITDPINGIFNPSIAGPGTHTITYTIPGACGDVQSIDIVVNPLPVVSFSVDNTSGCIPVTATFTDNTGLAGSSVTWSMSDGFISSSTGSVTHDFTSVGCFDVTLQVTSAQGCVSSITQNSIVCVSGIPVAEFSWFPTNATVLNPTVNFTNESIGADTYEWDFAGLGSSTSTNPLFTFPTTTPDVYPVCLIATNNAGCVDTVCHDITIYDEFIVYVPNSFTPDNDGRNDIFLPVVSGHDPLSYEFMVFNRWGELIFQTQHSETGWDGTYKTVMSKEDTYVWKIKVKSAFNNETHDYIGHVNLLK